MDAVSADSIRCGERYCFSPCRSIHGGRCVSRFNSLRGALRWQGQVLPLFPGTCQPIQFAAGSATAPQLSAVRVGRGVSRFNSLRGALPRGAGAQAVSALSVSRFNSLRGALRDLQGRHMGGLFRVSRFNSLRGALPGGCRSCPHCQGVSADSIRCGERYGCKASQPPMEAVCQPIQFAAGSATSSIGITY